MTTISTQVAPVQRAQFTTVSQVLARAFDDDPTTVYILPDEGQRRRVLPRFFSMGLRLAELYGEPYTTAGTPEAGALWLPPNGYKISPWRMVRSGMLKAPLVFGLSAFGRFLNVMNHLEHLHDRDMGATPHWYLFVLGVDPSRQGQGVGGALIVPKLAQADREGLPCYLETMKPRNVTFYQKHGFEVVVEDDLPKGGPHYWTMKRAPR